MHSKVLIYIYIYILTIMYSSLTTTCVIFFFFCDLPQTIARTRDNIVKKQALTYEEIEAEREEVSK